MAGKKKWGNSRDHEAINNKVVLTTEEHASAIKDLTKVRVLTPAFVSERCKVSVSIAHKLLAELVAKDAVEIVVPRAVFSKKLTAEEKAALAAKKLAEEEAAAKKAAEEAAAAAAAAAEEEAAAAPAATEEATA